MLILHETRLIIDNHSQSSLYSVETMNLFKTLFKKREARFFLILVLVLTVPLTVFISQKQQNLKQKATGNNTTEFGIQIDLNEDTKIPSSAQFAALNPSWIRFVYRPDKPIHSFSSGRKSIVIFNHESAGGDVPLESTDFNAWKSYFDTSYFPALRTFVESNPNTSAIEIWNEEDHCSSGVYCPRIPETAYAYLIKNAAHIIKTQNASIKVIMGGLADGQPGYITNVKNADPASLSQVDAVGIHPYGKTPDGWGAEHLPFGELSDSIILYRAASAPLDIWITEIGLGLDDSVFQAEYVRRSFTLASSINVPVVIWYGWIDSMTGGNGSNNWGLYTADSLVMKQSGLAFASFTSLPNTPTSGIQATPTPSRLDGDIDGDGSVTLTDFTIWKTGYLRYLRI